VAAFALRALLIGLFLDVAGAYPADECQVNCTKTVFGQPRQPSEWASTFCRLVRRQKTSAKPLFFAAFGT
jgi:hypothetical protein